MSWRKIMPLVLRKTRTNTIWDKSANEFSWLEKGDIAADAVTDLATSDNDLSIYVINDDLSQLDRCLSALAASRMRLIPLDYILFDKSVIDRLGLETNAVEGNLLDIEVNKLHRNIIELSASKLIKLSNIIMDECKLKRILDDQVANIIANSINNKWIKAKSIHKNLLEDIEKHYPIETL